MHIYYSYRKEDYCYFSLGLEKLPSPKLRIYKVNLELNQEKVFNVQYFLRLTFFWYEVCDLSATKQHF